MCTEPAANLITGFFGGVGGCAMIGQRRYQRQLWRQEAFIRNCCSYHPSSFLSFRLNGSISRKIWVLNDPQEVIIDFKESRVVDHSAIEALNKLTERYARVGKTVRLPLSM